MNGPIARVLVRYVSGALVMKGLLDAGVGKQIASDPDLVALVQTGLGLLMSAVTEGFYWLAKRYGWKT